MVTDRITDGKRIAELLASELTGLEEGVLADVSVSDADRDAEPTPEGTRAYVIRFDGECVATVVMYPEYVAISTDVYDPLPEGERRGVTVTVDGSIRVLTGAAVKPAVDVLRTGLSRDR